MGDVLIQRMMAIEDDKRLAEIKAEKVKAGKVCDCCVFEDIGHCLLEKDNCRESNGWAEWRYDE